jgi:hypothetical protein
VPDRFACAFVCAATRDGTQRKNNAAVATKQKLRHPAIEPFSYLLPV